VAIGFFTEVILGILFAAFCIFFCEPLVYALGSTKTIAPYAISYAKYILLGTPFIMASLGMNNMLRFQGNAFYSMLGISTGGILNMFLDPLFIYGFHMGIMGAAVATTLSQIVSFLILLFQCNKMPACISVSFRNFKPTGRRYSLILQFGLPSLARQGIAGVSTIILNFSAHPYGDAAIAAMAIVMRITMFLNSLVIGFGQGFQPVCGYCYGAKNYKRVEKAYYYSLKICFFMLLVMGALVFLFAKPIITFFRREDREVIRIGYLALRLQCLTIPLAAQLTMANMFSQTTGYPFRASIVALLRQGICLIPVLFVLPPLFGLLGVQMSQPVSDVFAAIIAFLITDKILKELREK
jgi:MATE efflux family protein